MCSFIRVKRPEREVYYSALSNEFKNEWSHISTPLARIHIVDEDSSPDAVCGTGCMASNGNVMTE